MWRTTSVCVAFARLAEDGSGTFLRFSAQIQLPYVRVSLIPTTILFQDSNVLGKDAEIKESYSFCFIPQFNCLWRVLSFSERWRTFPDNEEHLLHELQKGMKINSRPQCFTKHFLPKLVMKLFDLWVLRYLHVSVFGC